MGNNAQMRGPDTEGFRKGGLTLGFEGEMARPVPPVEVGPELNSTCTQACALQHARRKQNKKSVISFPGTLFHFLSVIFLKVFFSLPEAVCCLLQP